MGENKKILVVEDEVLTGIYLEHQLKQFGYDVAHSIASGEEAIDFVKNDRPDLILMDIRLAGVMDGFQTAKEILYLYKTYIIFMTGFHDEDYRLRANELNKSWLLLKPIKILELLKIIDTFKL